MEPVTVHLLRGKNPSFNNSRAAPVALLLFICCTVLLLCTKLAEAEEQNSILEESGIRYPDGFELDTVGEVQGKASGFFQPDKGPVRFYLSSKRETYTVIVSPKWYWNDLRVKISDGEEVLVLGSKSLGKDGNLYIIAQKVQILSTGQSFVLRGKDGTPLWKGPRTGTQGGIGSPLRGRGGIGSGSGGMGRGRR
jgi:hypothetical protein